MLGVGQISYYTLVSDEGEALCQPNTVLNVVEKASSQFLVRHAQVEVLSIARQDRQTVPTAMALVISSMYV